MKVLTLNAIYMYIQKKVAKVEQKVVVDAETGIQFIVDASYGGHLTAYYENQELVFSKDVDDSRVHCILLVEDLEKSSKGVSFMSLEGALNGILVIDNRTPSYDDIKDYVFDLEVENEG